jgi:anti-sigma factor RsiW
MMREEHPDDAVWLERACGDASESEHSGADEHLRTCSECQQRLAAFEDIVASLRAPRPGNVPLHVLTKVLERQKAEREARRPFAPQALRFAAALLAGLLLFAGGYSSGRHQAGAGSAARSTASRQPLPAPPRLVIEPATAGLGDLALAPWARDSSHADGVLPPATRDSL